MQVTVDTSRCESHGQCVFAAPEVFSFDDDDVIAYDAAPSAASHQQVRMAAAMCPVRAVSISEASP